VKGATITRCRAGTTTNGREFYGNSFASIRGSFALLASRTKREWTLMDANLIR